MNIQNFASFISNNSLPSVVIIYPGRFQPAHKNHAKVYSFLTQKFPYADVYISTSNKIQPPKSPFTFDEKKTMLTAAGIPESAIVQTTNPYVALEITKKYDKSTTRLIFAVGAKDMDPSNPRFNFLPTKKGDAFFKPLSKIDKLTPNKINKLYTFDQHGYVATIPTFNFTINIVGSRIPITGASQIRDLYKTASVLGKQEIIKQLYGSYSEKIFNLFNERLL